MQERLVQIGNWLKVNGEGVYGTHTWKTSAQWSQGSRPVFTKKDYHSGFPVFEMTLNPKPDNAVKEIWFTAKGNNLYAFVPGWPDDEKLIIKDLRITPESNVELLGSRKELPFNVSEKGIELDLSEIGINDLEGNYVYCIKITNVKL